MRFSRTSLLLSISGILTACGGGGGGGGAGGGSSNPYLRPEVPFSTPIRVGTVDPLVNNSYTWANTGVFTANISGNGETDVIIAGRSSDNSDLVNYANSRINMFSWENGTLVDKTAQWFPNNSNIILGTEPSVKFADFFHTGRNDMFVNPSTDAQLYGPAYVFKNEGTSFSKLSLNVGNIWSHDSAVVDLDGDGYKDIIMTDYGHKTTLAINNRVNNFNIYTDSRGSAGDLRWGGSSVAAADFLQNGRTQLIMTDNTCSGAVAACSNSSYMKMYTWNIDSNTNELNFTYHSTLPPDRFSLPKWAGLIGNGGGHGVRIVVYDFSDDGVPDAIVFSRPSQVSLKYSEIQFLKNNGSGTFTDVTDTTLVGYNTNTHSTYNPRFIDLNGDGRIDILVSGTDFSGNNTSTQFLLKSTDGKYVSAYQNIMTDFVKQVNQMQNTDNIGNTVNIFKAPDGKLYLVTAVSYMNGTDRQLAVYMSNLGSQKAMSAQTAVELIKQAWPYMTDAQANKVLAQTASAYYNGVGELDIDAAMRPIGNLMLALNNKITAIQGYLAGVRLGDAPAVAMDSIGRSFSVNLQSMNINRLNAFGFNTEHIDQHQLSSHAEYLINGNVVNFNGFRIGNENQTAVVDPMVLRKPTQFTIGMPNLYRKDNFSYGVQYTSLNSNPWLGMSGAWGEVNSTAIMDNVFGYQDGGFSARASLMHITTNINPGLVTKVSNMIGTWAEAGYRFANNVGVYAGVKPMIVSGSIDTRLPTGIDMQGNISYTNRTLAMQNQTTGYIRALWNTPVTKNVEYRINGIVTTDRQYRVSNEMRVYF